MDSSEALSIGSIRSDLDSKAAIIFGFKLESFMVIFSSAILSLVEIINDNCRKLFLNSKGFKASVVAKM